MAQVLHLLASTLDASWILMPTFMNRSLRVTVSLLSVIMYLLCLKFIFPSNEPYYLLGTLVVGVLTWFWGGWIGTAAAGALTYFTDYIYNQFVVSPSVLTPPNLILLVSTLLFVCHARRRFAQVQRKEKDLASSNVELVTALSNVKELGGIYMICSHCKTIQDKDGSWLDITHFLKEQSKMEFSHGICPHCAEKLIPIKKQGSPS